MNPRAFIACFAAISLTQCDTIEETPSSTEQPRLNHVWLTIDSELTQTQLDDFKALGIDFLGRRIERQYVVKVPDSLAPALDGTPSPSAILAGLNLTSPTIADKVDGKIDLSDPSGTFIVQTYSDVPLDAALTTINADAYKVEHYGPWSWRVSTLDITRIAVHDYVKRIELGTFSATLYSGTVRPIVESDTVHAAGIEGQGVRAGISDTAVFDIHQEFDDETFYATNFRPGYDPVSETFYPDYGGAHHGTLVTSIVGGNGTVSSDLKGHGPKVELGAFPTMGVHVAYLANVLGTPFHTDVTNHSYGLHKIPGYLIETAGVDAVIRGDARTYSGISVPRAPQVWAGGGVLDPFRTGQQILGNEGKNAIVVASVDSSTCGGGSQCRLTGKGMGPTPDGRFKPDLVAPGCGTAKGNDNGIKGASPPSDLSADPLATNQQQNDCGSSFAAPVVTGVISLIMEQLDNAFGAQRFQHPATYKALLIQTAVDQVGPIPADEYNIHYWPGPDRATGWGLVNAEAARQLAVDSTRIHENALLTTISDADEYCFSPAAGDVIKATLAWDDLPGESCGASEPIPSPPSCGTSTVKLVQDLDLTVKAADGTVYHPYSLHHDAVNDLYALQTDVPDRLNNVEMVHFTLPGAEPPEGLETGDDDAAPEDKKWTIKVAAHHLIRAQPYSLASSHSLDPTCSDQPASPLSPPSFAAEEASTTAALLFDLSEPVALDDICTATTGCSLCGTADICPGFHLTIYGLDNDTSVYLVSEDPAAADQELDRSASNSVYIPVRSASNRLFIEARPPRGAAAERPIRVRYGVRPLEIEER